ncbi:MAG TPA: YceI family protein [Pelobium sp.]|nr:YceI family protein [Pelobium sp.]
MATQSKWILDPTHSEIQFKVKHLVISTVTGTFKNFEASLITENEDFTDAEIDFSIAVDSIDTNQTDRDNHLKSADFFDAENFPAIKFKSTSFVKDGDDYILNGDITVKDITKPIKFDVEFGGTATDFYNNEKAGFEITGKISRKEFGLTWSAVTEAGAIVVGDDIKLSASVQFVKQVQA